MRLLEPKLLEKKSQYWPCIKVQFSEVTLIKVMKNSNIFFLIYLC